jgi:hypothetical protein
MKSVMQDVLAEYNLPKTILSTIENINPSECIASLGALVKVLSPDRSKNELFAQQYISVRIYINDTRRFSRTLSNTGCHIFPGTRVSHCTLVFDVAREFCFQPAQIWG